MKKSILFMLMLAGSILFAETIELPNSAGKFGTKLEGTLDDGYKAPIDQAVSRSSCYGYVWLIGKTKARWWWYYAYAKYEVNSKTIASFGSDKGSCNIPWNTTVKVVMDCYWNRRGYTPANVCHKEKSLFGSYAQVSHKGESWAFIIPAVLEISDVHAKHQAGSMTVYTNVHVH